MVLLIAGGIGVTPLLNILSTLLSQCQKGRANNLVKVLFVWSVRDQAVGDSIYQDFLIPIVEDSKEIHQSYAYTSSLSHTNHLDQVHGGALNIPRKDIFTYSLHCTDPAYLSSDPVVPAANQVVGATNQAKSNEIKLQANREIKSSLAGSSSPKKMTTSPLHQSSSSSSSLAALGGNSGKVDDTPLWMPSRMSVPEYFTQAMSVLKKPVDGEKKMQRVAVFACGPEPLVEEVRLVQQRMNRNATHSHVNFDLHEEMFFY